MDRVSACILITAPARSIALRSQRMPNGSGWIGAAAIAGQRPATMIACAVSPAPARTQAAIQPRMMPMARMMLSASAKSTSDPREAALIAARAWA
jgi:hypothetical protein